MTPAVDVIFPCLGDAPALPRILRRLPEGYRAIVVGDQSSDDSADITRRLGALLVREPRPGFGAAVHTGLMTATAPVVAFCSADTSMDPADLPLVTGPVLRGTHDLVLGRRRPANHGAWPLHARVASAALAWLIRRATGLPLHDLGPMRAARRAALVHLDLRDRRSGYPLEMVLSAAREGWAVTEVDVPYSGGRSGFGVGAGDTLTAIGDMVRLLAEDRATAPASRQRHGGVSARPRSS